MIAITKSMVALSALLSAGLLAALASSGPRVDHQSAAAQVAQRFPLANEMFAPVSITSFAARKFAEAVKADRLPMSECARQNWPYLSQDCLVSRDGAPARKATRIITVERRIGDNTSDLVRVPVADLAQR